MTNYGWIYSDKFIYDAIWFQVLREGMFLIQQNKPITISMQVYKSSALSFL